MFDKFHETSIAPLTPDELKLRSQHYIQADLVAGHRLGPHRIALRRDYASVPIKFSCYLRKKNIYSAYLNRHRNRPFTTSLSLSSSLLYCWPLSVGDVGRYQCKTRNFVDSRGIIDVDASVR